MTMGGSTDAIMGMINSTLSNNRLYQKNRNALSSNSNFNNLNAAVNNAENIGTQASSSSGSNSSSSQTQNNSQTPVNNNPTSSTPKNTEGQTLSEEPKATVENFTSPESDIIQTVKSKQNEEIMSGWLVDDLKDSARLRIEFPDYGYDRYVNDIANWQKQRSTLGSDQGWFFFKVLFNFNTNYGLLGGIMQTIGTNSIRYADNEQNNNSDDNLYGPPPIPENISSTKLASTNTAIGYLASIRKRYTHDLIEDRILALSKFAISLKDISLKTPWLIKSISGLNNINSTYANNLDKEKSITIGLGEETLDSRLGTLIDLYKFSCFDQINCREIIPINLRKFEMSVLVYHMPIKYYDTKVLLSKEGSTKMTGKNFFKGILGMGEDLEFDGIVDAKTMSPNSGGDNFSNMMSFKLFTFLNCEIDTENLNEYYVDGITNDAPFKLGSNSLKIKYDRVYEHRMNEWIEAMFGSDGFQYNETVPSIISNNSSMFGYGVDDTYVRNSNIEEANQYRQRALAMQNRWYGKQTILDYTSLMIAKYYKFGKNIPGPATLGGLMSNISNTFGGTKVGNAAQKWTNIKDTMENMYNGFRRH